MQPVTQSAGPARQRDIEKDLVAVPEVAGVVTRAEDSKANLTAWPPNGQARGGEPEELEGPGEIFEWFTKLRDFAKFRKTRDAVLANEPLYDYRSAELNQRGYLGPWRFNLIQSTLSGLPALIIPALGRALGGQGVFEERNESLDTIVQSFAIPFILMLTAYVVGRASLWKRDATKPAKRRASKIFLYLDGAYGFYPQMAASAAWSLVALAPEIGGFLNLVGVWQVAVSMGIIPDQLFLILGYTVGSKDRTTQLFPSDRTLENASPPKWKYRLCILFVVPLIAITVLFAAYFVSTALHPLIRSLAA